MRARVGRLAVWVWLGLGAAAYAGEGGVNATAPIVKEPRSWRGAGWLDQWRQIERSPALDVPAPLTHDDEIQRVTLKEAIAIALENNPGFAARRLEPARRATS